MLYECSRKIVEAVLLVIKINVIDSIASVHCKV